ncbi:hypothetical protein ES288_D09G257000v1 [Gossypium darwinii]|uniref:DUF7081 domain-containing protein n=1 Tax=Gossypium darwinii TaxID=34276 RepID=A0A5D2BFG1_GOSDA|nr:hypothetical protein ES288_D09G257000v1 [Gossypium darwinii]TYG55252.1 hypothetical protein ES288_D09G257000v1 [Gossypium darwinii]
MMSIPSPSHMGTPPHSENPHMDTTPPLDNPHDMGSSHIDIQQDLNSHMDTPPHTENPNDMGSPHIDIHQDLFPDYYGGTASAPAAAPAPALDSAPSEPKHEFEGNDNHNGNNDSAPVIKDNNSPPPVPPGSSGEGLPYAPIHWPNAGDIWTWKVGRRVNSAGSYGDRFLHVPESLRKPNSPKVFASKPALERFIRLNFPDADVNAFFASFVWKIPAIVESPTKVAAAPAAPAEGTEDDKQESDTKGLRRTQRKRAPPPPPFSTPSSIEAPAAPEEGTEDVKQESNSKTPRRTQRKRAPPAPPVSTPNSSDGKKMQKNSKGSAKTKRPTRQRGKESAPPPAETEDMNSGLDLSFLDNETGRAEFDNYLSSLDEILAQPFSEEPFSHPAEMQNSFAGDSEMAEARRKLSSLLDMDFPSLICFKDLEELASLASKLRKDPTLTAEQLVKLKLIEEIPSFCEVFLENREVMEQADKFFRGLDDNRAKVSSLKQEYSELKQQVTNLESEVDSNTMTVQDIDNQIAQLKAHRAELTKLIDKKKRDKDELTYNQKLVANSIPKVVHEVQLANAKKPEWEQKKENALKREGEILAKFAPLKGFSL